MSDGEERKATTLAGMILQESLRKGKTITIPSLGIIIEPEKEIAPMEKSCLFPPTNYRWVCTKCKVELSDHLDDALQSGIYSPNCPKCGDAMEGRPFVCRGPQPEGLLKKY